MTYGLPDSMTYTMGRRVLSVIKDRAAQKSAELDSDLDTFVLILRVIGWMFLGAGYLILGALYVIASPILLLGKLMERYEERTAKKERAERYRRALEKRSQKNIA
jgi:hypothetical protein